MENQNWFLCLFSSFFTKMSKSSKNPLEQIVNFPIEKYKYTYQVSNLDKWKISKACKDGNKSTGGFKWKYIEKEDKEKDDNEENVKHYNIKLGGKR